MRRLGPSPLFTSMMAITTIATHTSVARKANTAAIPGPTTAQTMASRRKSRAITAELIRSGRPQNLDCRYLYPAKGVLQ